MTRKTKADLDNLASQLTSVMHDLGMIPADSSVIRAGAYGGHALHVLDADTGRRTGFAGLTVGYGPMGETYANGRAVVNALWAVKYVSA